MKTEIREVSTIERKRYYIADDGTEFTDRRECENYEFKQEVNKRQLSHYSCYDISDDRPATLWYIRSKEEFDWLKKTAWVHAHVSGEFHEDGWYIAVFYDGGDYADEYVVTTLEAYINYYEARIEEIRDLTRS